MTERPRHIVWNMDSPEEAKTKPYLPPDRNGEGVTGIGGINGVCQFIFGEPNGQKTRYCGKPVAIDFEAWCQEHRNIVIVKVRKEKTYEWQ